MTAIWRQCRHRHLPARLPAAPGRVASPLVDADALLDTLGRTAEEVGHALASLEDWGPAGTREGQYRSDLVADEAAVRLLLDAGLGVLSEESGLHAPDRPLLAVLDPVDGSTNAARGLPWYATSVCVLDGAGPVASVVLNQATGTRYEAVRGGGARRDGRPISPSGVRRLRESVIAVSGYPRHFLGWRQYRAFGAMALDLCSVAEGAFDGYVDCVDAAHGGPWDYLGALLVCEEAGAVVADARGRPLAELDQIVAGEASPRSPVAAGTHELLEELLTQRALVPGPTSR